jgi:phosphate butyryltransferase
MNSLTDLVTAAREYGRNRVAVVQAADETALEAVENARREGLVEAILVGQPAEIRAAAGRIGLDLAPYALHEPAEGAGVAREAARLVADGEADFLMKGLLPSADLLREVLNKDNRLTAGRLLSHVGVFAPPAWERLMLVTDGGLNIAPDLAQKVQIVQNAIDIARCLGVERPVAAVLCAVEMVNPAMPATLDAACLSKMSERGAFRGGEVEGPLALDNAISVESARHKGIRSELAGRAHILVTPNIEAGNILYKSMAYFGGMEAAAIITGARVPVVMTSRSDSPASKLYSIALAILSLRRSGG